jgi:hypothetical protein
MSQDFDFKIGRGHYRGHGICALVALAIDHLPRAALWTTGGITAWSTLPWLLQAVRAYVGH